tara:strand:- start:327 stop:827 length:501 start_codon:yes stop_codon:yes gene_type:complete
MGKNIPLYGQNKDGDALAHAHGVCKLVDPLGSDGATGSPTLTLTAADSGNIYFVDISSNTVYVELPDCTIDNMRFKFILHALSDNEATKDFVVQTAADAQDIMGHIFEDQAALTEITADTSMVQWDTSDGAATVGDWIELVSFDGHWYATGVANTAAAIDIADARA